MRQVKILAALILVLSALPLSGCAPLPFLRDAREQSVNLPAPTDSPHMPDLESGVREIRTEQIRLMYLSADMRRLVPVPVALSLRNDESLAEAALLRLLETPSQDGTVSVAPAGTRLLSFERSGSVATVNLAMEGEGIGAQQSVLMRAAICATLAQTPGITHVAFLMGGQAESVFDIPFGLSKDEGAQASAIWAKVQSDAAGFDPASPSRQIALDVALYFASEETGRVLPETREIRFATDDFILPVLRELTRGPLLRPESVRVLPDDMEPLAGAPSVTTSEDGRRLITLSLIPGFEEELIRRGISPRETYASFALTLLRFIPEVDGLVVRVGQNRVERLEDELGELRFEDGVMTQSHFERMLGDVGYVYLATEEGRLRKVGRVMAPYGVTQPRTLLETLSEGALSSEEGLLSALPPGASGSDILGADVFGDTGIVNLSENFYRCAQSLSLEQERLLVYAMVNTLTELPGVTKVRFFVDGESVDVLARQVYLRGTLIRNPGIVEQMP